MLTPGIIREEGNKVVYLLGSTAISLGLCLCRTLLRPFHHHTLMTMLPVS